MPSSDSTIGISSISSAASCAFVASFGCCDGAGGGSLLVVGGSSVAT
ncbi:MAG: hypothetical protein ACYTGP_05480 [Planctomycetota bacterium]